jgi:hypothetical protein
MLTVLLGTDLVGPPLILLAIEWGHYREPVRGFRVDATPGISGKRLAGPSFANRRTGR